MNDQLRSQIALAWGNYMHRLETLGPDERLEFRRAMALVADSEDWPRRRLALLRAEVFGVLKTKASPDDVLAQLERLMPDVVLPLILEPGETAEYGGKPVEGLDVGHLEQLERHYAQRHGTRS